MTETEKVGGSTENAPAGYGTHRCRRTRRDEGRTVMTEEENFLVVCKLCRRDIKGDGAAVRSNGAHYHQWCLDRAIENREAMTARVRELEGLATQSATATILANLDTRIERSRADAARKDSDTLYELKGWLRLCADTPAGHAEFYEWASHYMFGTPPPADRPGAGAAE